MSGGIARAGVGGGRRAASCVLSEGANELPEASISAIESRRSILGLVASIKGGVGPPLDTTTYLQVELFFSPENAYMKRVFFGCS